MVTARISELDLVKGIEDGADDYIKKPFSVMEQVWGSDYEGESRTIDMHVKTLRKKLGDYGSRIKTIRNVGYVME